jgi:hypothetical protein
MHTHLDAGTQKKLFAPQKQFLASFIKNNENKKGQFLVQNSTFV